MSFARRFHGSTGFWRLLLMVTAVTNAAGAAIARQSTLISSSRVRFAASTGLSAFALRNPASVVTV